jgi:hypothetical protein
MWWFNKLCAVGIRKPLDARDIYGLNFDDTSAALVPRWSERWDRALDRYAQAKREQPSGEGEPKRVEAPSIILQLFLLFKWDIVAAMTIKLLSDLLQFANPLLLK